MVNELTGTLIVTATPSQHASIEELMTQLESAGGNTAKSVRAYPIQNRDVGDVLDVLERLVEAGALEAGIVRAERAEAAADSPVQADLRPVLPPQEEPQAPPVPQDGAGAGRRARRRAATSRTPPST